MKKILFGFAALTLIVLGACKRGKACWRRRQSFAAGIVPCSDTVVLPQVISGPRLLDKDSIYILNGKTYVSATGILTIEAGTRIEGVRKDSARDASALVITRAVKFSPMVTPATRSYLLPVLMAAMPLLTPATGVAL